MLYGCARVWPRPATPQEIQPLSAYQGSSGDSHHKTNMTITTILVWALVLLTLPALILLWATESRDHRIRRWHREGRSQRAIAEQLGISAYQVRKTLKAA